MYLFTISNTKLNLMAHVYIHHIEARERKKDTRNYLAVAMLVQDLWEWPRNVWFNFRSAPLEGAHAPHCLDE